MTVSLIFCLLPLFAEELIAEQELQDLATFRMSINSNNNLRVNNGPQEHNNVPTESTASGSITTSHCSIHGDPQPLRQQQLCPARRNKKKFQPPNFCQLWARVTRQPLGPQRPNFAWKYVWFTCNSTLNLKEIEYKLCL